MQADTVDDGGADSSYSPSKSTSVEKTEKDKIDPLIHTGYFHTGDANTLIFIVGWRRRRQLLCHALKNPLKHSRAV